MGKTKEYWEQIICAALEQESEQNDLDFKSDVSSDKKRLKEHINAFAHTSGGGAFVFGIDDSVRPYRFTGDTLTYSEIQHQISNLAQTSQVPPIGVDNYLIKISLGVVLCIHVHEGFRKPVFIKDRAPFSGEACFKRTAASTVPMSDDEIRFLLVQSTGHSYDESPLQDAVLSDLNFKALGKIFKKLKTENPEDSANLRILQDNNIICKSGSTYRPTIAGFLVFAKELQGIKKFTNAYIEFQQFRDNTRASPIKKTEIRGSIQHQLEKSIELLMQHLWVMPKIEKGGRRIEIPAYDEAIVREVLTNALVHRDYTKMYWPVKIALFNDRVEIENAGGLLPGITTLNFIHKRDWRNPILAQLIKKIGFGEMDGQGIDRIYELSRQIRVPVPVFRDERDSFLVTLIGPKDFNELTPEQKRNSVVVLLIFEKSIDNEMLRNTFSIKAEQATNLIKSMLEEGIIISTSKSRKFAKYHFTEKYNQLVNS